MARETWVQSQVESYQRPKKMVLDASLLNTQHYKVRIKGKVEQSREGVAPSPTHWCSSYRKGSLRVTLDYGRQLYLLIYLLRCRLLNIGLVSRVFVSGPGDRGSIPGWVLPKTQKWYLIPPCLTLSTIRYVSRVKWSNPGRGVEPSLHFSVVAIEKRAFGSPSNTVANFTYFTYCLRVSGKKQAPKSTQQWFNFSRIPV